MWKAKESDSPWHDLIRFEEFTPGTNLAQEVGNRVPQMFTVFEGNGPL